VLRRELLLLVVVVGNVHRCVTGVLDLFDSLNDDSEVEANQHSATNRETSAAHSVPDKAAMSFSPPEDDSSDEIEEMDAPAPKKTGSSFEQLRAMKNQGGKPSSITLLGMMKPKPAKTLSSIDKLLAMKAGTQASDSQSDEDSDDDESQTKHRSRGSRRQSSPARSRRQAHNTRSTSLQSEKNCSIMHLCLCTANWSWNRLVGRSNLQSSRVFKQLVKLLHLHSIRLARCLSNFRHLI